MFKGEVQAFDAICVIVLMECAFFTGFLDNINVKDFVLMDGEKFEYLFFFKEKNYHFNNFF